MALARKHSQTFDVGTTAGPSSYPALSGVSGIPARTMRDHDRVEALCQEAEDVGWTTLRAIAQEHGMGDPTLLTDKEQQLLWMGLKAGTAAGVELVLDVQRRGR